MNAGEGQCLWRVPTIAPCSKARHSDFISIWAHFKSFLLSAWHFANEKGRVSEDGCLHVSLFRCTTTTTTRFGLEQQPSKVQDNTDQLLFQNFQLDHLFHLMSFFFFHPNHKSFIAPRIQSRREKRYRWHQGVSRLLKFTRLEGIKKSTQHNKTPQKKIGNLGEVSAVSEVKRRALEV